MGIGQPFAGPEHSQCIEGYLWRTAGLTVVAPGSAVDAAGLLRSAIRLGNPVVFLEHRRLYDVGYDVSSDELRHAETPIGEAAVARSGDAITVVAWGWMRLLAERAAVQLSSDGIEIEIVDPRTIKPLDIDTITASAAKTGALLVVEEAPRTGCIGDSIISTVTRDIDLPRRRASTLTMPDLPLPFDQDLADSLVPTVEEICDEVVRLTRESPVAVGR